MTYLVLDASIALGWMVDTPAPKMALRALHLLQSGTIGVVPDLWYYEISNALITAERRGRASAQVVSSHVSDIERLAAFLELSPTTPSALIAAARLSGLTAYDAAYFELALRRNLPLATLDDKMRTAAQKVGIEVLR
ncbi:MAG: type II toxin-antitoxin system VapC family toxin [Terriglobia bacterium]